MIDYLGVEVLRRVRGSDIEMRVIARLDKLQELYVFYCEVSGNIAVDTTEPLRKSHYHPSEYIGLIL